MLVIVFSICLFIIREARPQNEDLKQQLPGKAILGKLTSSKFSKNGDQFPFDSQSSLVRPWTKDSVNHRRTSFTKEDIDKTEIDDLNVEYLLDGMIVGQNGVHFKPLGLRPEQTPRAIAEAYQISSEIELRKSHRRKRSFIPRYSKFNMYWINATVLYYIAEETFSNIAKVRSLIKEQMDIIESKTCIRFVEKNSTEISEMIDRNDYSFIQIEKFGAGCYAHVGRYGVYAGIRIVKHVLNLEEPGCITKSIIGHELGHVLGMTHEFSRSDRDEHFKVNVDRVPNVFSHNFKKEKTINRTPFDYSSLMQYTPTDYSFSRQEKVLEIRDPDLEFLLRASDDLSYYDIMAINKAYKCFAACESRSCENGAVRGETCECLCPEGLTGPSCDKVVNSDICGGIIEIIPGTETVIKSTKTNQLPPDGAKCYWLLKAPKEYSITIEIDDINLQWNKKMNRCYHWLQINYNLIGQPAPRYCGDSFPRGKISSTKYGETNLMMLKWDTMTVSGVPIEGGFKLRANAYRVYGIQSEGCPKPPEFKNAVSNYKDVGSRNGAIVIYKCIYPYTMFGDVGVITCQADNTWSNPSFKCMLKEPTFACDFETSDCGILQRDDLHQWRRTVVEGEAFYRINNAGNYQPVGTSNLAAINPLVQPYKQYCLSLSLRRPFGPLSCATYNILGVDSGYVVSYLMSSRYCNIPNWVTYAVTFSVNEPVTILINTSTRPGAMYNLDLDNIIVREGRC